MPRASGEATFEAGDALALLDWKRQVFDLYASIRADDDPVRAWRRWLETRDRLFRRHPQSPLRPEARSSFQGCSYFDYDSACCVVGEVVDADPVLADLDVSTGGTFRFTRVGVVRFELHEAEHEFELDWNEGYGGGLFLAFRDASCGESTYGGGRYLLDTVKGADLGSDRDRRRVVLDFNFAFNPSCAYDPRWACPLAPAANTLPFHMAAGEKSPPPWGQAPG